MKPDLKNSGNEKRRRGHGALWFVAGGIVAIVLIFAFPAIHNALRHAETSTVKHATALKKKMAKTPSAASASEPSFDFYELLSHPTQILTSGESDEVKTPPASRSVTQPGTYVLQVASLREDKDAEALKAQLALWGISAHVQKVRVQGEIWHRVRVGPMSDLATLNALREKLDAHKLKPLLIRVSD